MIQAPIRVPTMSSSHRCACQSFNESWLPVKLCAPNWGGTVAVTIAFSVNRNHKQMWQRTLSFTTRNKRTSQESSPRRHTKSQSAGRQKMSRVGCSQSHWSQCRQLDNLPACCTTSAASNKSFLEQVRLANHSYFQMTSI